MKAELTTVLDEVRVIASRRGWDDVEALTSALVSADASAILLAVPKGVNAEPLRRWIEEAAPGERVATVALEGLIDDPVPALTVDRLVTVVECGRLVEPAAAQAVAEAFFPRPPGSFAIVLVGAERIETEEDLKLVERMAWRLLVPEQAGGTATGDLLAHGCMLWSSGDPPAFLEGRVRRDRQALDGWLREPARAGDELDLRRILQAVELAEQRTYDEAPAAEPVASDLQARRYRRTREELSELRRRLARRLDADAASLERQLVASLQGLEQDLLNGLKPRLAQRLKAGSGDTRQVLADYVSEGIQRWQREATELLRSRYAEIESETDALFKGIDWAAVNEVTADASHGRYPDALLQDLLTSPEFRLVNQVSPGGTAPSTRQGKDAVVVVRMVVAGSIVMAAAALLLGPVGFAGLMTAGVAGMVGERLFDRLVAQRQAARLGEADSRVVIAELVKQAVETVRGHVKHSVAPLRDRLTGDLRQIEAAMDRAVTESRKGNDQEPPGDPDREQLADLRRRAVAAAVDPA